MLSIAKISNADYYLKNVSTGIEDYYSLGEAPGRWTVQTHELLGVTGEVLPEQLTAVLGGAHPVTGAVLLQSSNRTVPAFDLTFRAPKSVSIAFGLGNDTMTSEVIAAHDAAVDAAFGYLERTAAWSRKGHNGVEQIAGDGFVGAAFRHRTSRAGDPHLHTHVLVPNMIRGEDGKWRTIDARHIYAQSLTAGYVYESHLREELTRRLGVSWGPIVNGIADIHGIPANVIKAFSTRREQIEARMAIRGDTSAHAAEIAALDTRKAKDPTVSIEQLRHTWTTTAIGHGYPPEQLAGLINPARQHLLIPTDPGIVARIEQHLLSPDGLTARSSTFDRRDVLRALAGGYPDGANVQLLEAHADTLLTHPDIIQLTNTSTDAMRNDNGKAVTRVELGARYTTRELLELEQRLVSSALARQSNNMDGVPATVLTDVLAKRPTLAVEQRALIEQVTLSRSGVQVITAPAGAGKTFALAVANEAWAASGYDVIGAALSARAGAELEATAQIPSMTLARLAANPDVIARSTVVVIDEFGMAPTRLVAPISDRAHRVGAKLVLVGDPRQLPEIGAGGLLAGLADRLPVIELVENRRQRNPWEQTALTHLRNGRVDKALNAYAQHGRIITTPTATGTKQRLVDDWATARSHGVDAIILASRNADIADLNTIARARRHEHGALTGPVLRVEVGDQVREFQAGDEILLLRNDRRNNLRNGTRAVIEEVREHSNYPMTVNTVDGTRIGMPHQYLANGHVTHGYAMTIHKAQGLTCDHALVYATDDLYQELGYVAMSRGRTNNTLYHPGTPALAADHEPHVKVQERSPRQGLLAGLSTSRAQQLAIDTQANETRVPYRQWSAAELNAEFKRLQAVLDAAPKDRQRELTQRTNELEQLRYDLDFYERRCNHLVQTPRTRRERRNGPHPDLDAAIQNRALARISITTTQHHIYQLTNNQTAREQYLAEHADIPHRIKQLETLIRDKIENAVANDMIDTPEYLDQIIGAYRNTKHSEHWIEAARHIEHHRHTNAITDPHHPYGPETDTAKDLHRWNHLRPETRNLNNPEPQPKPAIEVEAEPAVHRRGGIRMSM